MRALFSRSKVWPMLLACVCLAAVAPAGSRGDDWPHVEITQQGVPDEYVQAIGQVIETARAVAVERYGFDMPERIFLTVRIDRRGRTRLFNDGANTFSLTVRSDRDLRKPMSSKIFHLYGLCHETAHLAMYRPIKDHSWMTTAAAEGWAHYLGSRIVDEVYERHGADLWPDRYDYRDDGMRRLERQLMNSGSSATVEGARLWMQLVDIVGDRGVAPIFEAWGKADVDPAQPGEALLDALTSVNSQQELTGWWERARPVLLQIREKSEFAAQTINRNELTGSDYELAHDDGKSAGKKSIAGSAHAARFEVSDNSWYLTSVRVYGSRYGSTRPPKEDFHLWLCDEDYRVIADFRQPYSLFKRGRDRWVTLRVRPTNVPPQFIVCVGFNPTARKGVYVHYDGEGEGQSLVGLPGKRPRTFDSGDWMIRASVDQLNSADALRTEQSSSK